MTRPRMLERDVETKTVAKAKANNWLSYKIAKANIRGVPDRLFLKNGRHVWVEFKATGKKPRRNQLKRISELTAAGAEVHVIDHPDQASAIFGT